MNIQFKRRLIISLREPICVLLRCAYSSGKLDQDKKRLRQSAKGTDRALRGAMRRVVPVFVPFNTIVDEIVVEILLEVFFFSKLFHAWYVEL
jgi:hypothetical protein